MEEFSAQLEVAKVHKHHKKDLFNNHMSRMVTKVQKTKSKTGPKLLAKINEEKMENELLKKQGFNLLFFDKVYRVLRDPTDKRIVVVASEGEANIPVWIIALRFRSDFDCDRFVRLIQQKRTAHVTYRKETSSSSSSSSSSPSSSNDKRSSCKIAYIDTSIAPESTWFRSERRPQGGLADRRAIHLMDADDDSRLTYLSAPHNRRSKAHSSRRRDFSSSSSSSRNSSRVARGRGAGGHNSSAGRGGYDRRSISRIKLARMDGRKRVVSVEPGKLFLFDSMKFEIQNLDKPSRNNRKRNSKSQPRAKSNRPESVFMIQEAPRRRR